jgi:mono/diheme cytochrome c family protein
MVYTVDPPAPSNAGARREGRRQAPSARLAARAGAVIGAVLLAAAICGATTPMVQAQTRKISRYDSGEYLYRVYCASCHGPGGAGDGPVAPVLNTPLPDLRTIATRAGGGFPRDQVIARIDGRTVVPSHGTRDMPVWGDQLKITEGPDEPAIRKRIDAIAEHLESIQAKER